MYILKLYKLLAKKCNELLNESFKYKTQRKNGEVNLLSSIGAEDT